MLLGILGACGNKKTNIDPFASITKEVDSIRRIADSIHCDESPEDPQPIQADESFDDFIYNFASDLPHFRTGRMGVCENTNGKEILF